MNNEPTPSENHPLAIPVPETEAETPAPKPKRTRGKKTTQPPAVNENEDKPAAPDVFDEAIAAQQGSQAPGPLKLNEDNFKHRRHPNLNCIFRDEEAGIRLDREEKRLEGEMAPRLLITFSDDKLPTKDETEILKREGFRFHGEDRAWWRASSPANQVIAKIVINQLLELRGIDHQIAVSGMGRGRRS